jgi:energy-coupling factor transporter ATP-binding protein EcfA2
VYFYKKATKKAMLIEFRIANYRSIGEEQIISLFPAGQQQEYPQNIFYAGRFKALNAVALYGANGSGKSNLLKAIGLLERLVKHSAANSSVEKLPYDPFLLRQGWQERPCTIELTFVIPPSRYRYGLSFRADAVEQEWLFRKTTGREVLLFQREGEVIDVRHGLKGNKSVINVAIDATRPNGLFLSRADTMNVEEVVSIMGWFRRLLMIDSLQATHHPTTISLLQQADYHTLIRHYLQQTGVGLTNIELVNPAENSVVAQRQDSLQTAMSRVRAIHKRYAEDGMPTGDFLHWSFDERESAGTKKAFHLSGPVLWTLLNGGVLVADEIEAAMHPLMTLKIIELFLNPETNPNQAQLIFATHDTNLLSYARLRRDQIYFVEKNDWESSELYSLSDFVYYADKEGAFKPAKERMDANKEKRYMEGRYGAVPLLGKFQELIRQIQWQRGER